MTSTRYFYARIAQAFGLHRRSLRMADAASEMHLLREAESYLGSQIWENIEKVEDLAVEYWNMRKLIKERAEAQERLDVCQQRLDKAHEERATLLLAFAEPHHDLIDKRVAILNELETLAMKRDEIIAYARKIRRNFDGMKMKLEVLTNEPGEAMPDQEIEEVKARIAELKRDFNILKAERDQIAAQIKIGDDKIDVIDAELNARRQSRRADTSEAFAVIGEANKEVSLLRAEIGLLDNQIHELHSEIGRYVSRNVHSQPACAEASSAHRSLVDVMRALRRSVALNHRLAGFT